MAGDDIMAVLTQPTVDVPLAGRVLGIGKAAAYSAARDGSLPSFRVGSQIRVPTARLRAMLGLPEQPPAASAPIAA